MRRTLFLLALAACDTGKIQITPGDSEDSDLATETDPGEDTDGGGGTDGGGTDGGGTDDVGETDQGGGGGDAAHRIDGLGLGRLEQEWSKQQEREHARV